MIEWVSGSKTYYAFVDSFNSQCQPPCRGNVRNTLFEEKSNGLEYWGDNLVFGRLSAARDMLLLPVSNLCLLTVHSTLHTVMKLRHFSATLRYFSEIEILTICPFWLISRISVVKFQCPKSLKISTLLSRDMSKVSASYQGISIKKTATAFNYIPACTRKRTFY